MKRSTHRSTYRKIASASLVASAALLAPVEVSRAQTSTIVATWRTAEIAVDGSTADWESLARIGEGPAVSARNDVDDLYLAIASSDPMVRVQLATGLIVWLDASGRRQQSFGLRLEGLAPRPLAGAAPTPSTSTLPDRVVNPLDQFDLLGPARLQRRLIDDPGGAGFRLASGVENDTIVYEMRIPLVRTDATPHALGAKPGASISLGIETPPDLQRGRARNRLDNPMSTSPWVQDPWGYGGYFTTPPPPPGGRPRPPEELRPLRLVWTTVRLATAP
jgi:hypothetical protein